jgi:acyl carrier protein
MNETPNPANLHDRVKNLIVTRLKLEVDPASIDSKAPIFGGGLGLDSIDALELVLGIEQEFGVRIDDEEIGSAALASVEALSAFLVERGVAA